MKKTKNPMNLNMKKNNKNPMTPTLDNIRRWAIINIPKFQNKIEDYTYIEADKLRDSCKRFFNLGKLSYEEENIIYYGSALFEHIMNFTMLTKFQKLNIWKYYMRNLIRLYEIYSQYDVLQFKYSNDRVKFTKEFTKLLLDNYDK